MFPDKLTCLSWNGNLLSADQWWLLNGPWRRRSSLQQNKCATERYIFKKGNSLHLLLNNIELTLNFKVPYPPSVVELWKQCKNQVTMHGKLLFLFTLIPNNPNKTDSCFRCVLPVVCTNVYRFKQPELSSKLTRVPIPSLF